MAWSNHGQVKAERVDGGFRISGSWVSKPAAAPLLDSQAHCEDALTFCRKAGYRPDLAWSLSDYADMLLERNGGGDHDKATALLVESLAISSELEMRPLMEWVLSRRDILKA